MTIQGPMRLSETGLYADFGARTLAPGVIEFAPRYPLWSDGAEKRRFLLLPPGSKIDTRAMDYWSFPVGTKAWKQFTRDGKVVETRLLWKGKEGKDGWWEIAYAWDGAGADATAVPDGVDNALGTPHHVPSQLECFRCHGGVTDVLIGVSAIQLSRAGGQGPLTTLANAGWLSDPPPAEFDPPGQGSVQDTLGYLHGNCGHCHNQEAIFLNLKNLRMRLLTTFKTPEETDTYTTSIHLKTFHEYPAGVWIAVEPGQPTKSQLYMRMATRDDFQMPPVCTRVVDDVAVKLVGDWITALPP
jgi:hypothetical protein